jgi:hypothetical protein
MPCCRRGKLCLVIGWGKILADEPKVLGSDRSSYIRVPFWRGEQLLKRDSSDLPDIHWPTRVVHANEPLILTLLQAYEASLDFRCGTTGDARANPIRVQSRPCSRMEERFLLEVTCL